MTRRAVVSGIGTVSALGAGVTPFWHGLTHGLSGLRPLAKFDPSGFGIKVAGEARLTLEGAGNEFTAKDFVPKSYRKAVKVMARDIELAVAAAKFAIEDAGLITRGSEAPPGTETYAGDRMGCQIGAGLIAAETDELSSAMASSVGENGTWDLRAWGTVEAVGGKGAMNNLQPLWLLKYLPNMLACHVTIIHGCEGPSNTITCGEASGLLSLGEAARVIERDAADICLSGGAESKINLMGLLRMKLAGRLAESSEDSQGWKVVRPYDPASPGSVMGEAGGILILEESTKAKARNARIYATVAGFGAAHSPPPAYEALGRRAGAKFQQAQLGEGPRFAIEAALHDARLSPDQINAIVPHAAGVPSVDTEEAAGLRSVFGNRLAQIPLITLTPGVGECNAGLGALQVAAAALALHSQRLPARIHHGMPAPGLLAGASPGGPGDLRHVLVLSNSLGGQNAAMVLSRAD